MSAVGKDYRKKRKLGSNWFWFSCECGLVICQLRPAVKIISKDKGVTCMCKHCQGFWRSCNGGTRMVQISTNREHIQLVLDEPPESAYNEWARSRIAFYQRVEPNAPPRDTSPPKMAKYRIRFSGAASDAIWSVGLIRRRLPLQQFQGWLHSMFNDSLEAQLDGFGPRHKVVGSGTYGPVILHLPFLSLGLVFLFQRVRYLSSCSPILAQ